MRGRDNGLDAEAYKPLTDLDPEAADLMLDALRDAGIAAYVSALEPPAGGGAPHERIERLWVDSAATSRARAILRELTEPSSPRSRPQPPAVQADPADPPARSAAKERDAVEDGRPRPEPEPPGDDEVWAQIVASFDTEVTDRVPRWPVAEDLGGKPGAEDRRRPGPGGSGGDGSFRVGLTPAPGPRDYSLAPPGSERGPKELEEDPEEHFVPPPPPPLPKTDAATKCAWVALVGGPLYLLVSVLLGRPVGAWSSLFAFAAFTGGFVALVARMRRDRDDDDPDDGAVV